MPFGAFRLFTPLAVTRNCLICSLVSAGSSAATAKSRKSDTILRQESTRASANEVGSWRILNRVAGTLLHLGPNGQPKIAETVGAKPIEAARKSWKNRPGH